MDLEYSDEKGKIFTDVITKRPVFATLQTTTHLLRGNIHVRRGQRIKDELDLDEKFVAVTDADILTSDGQVLFHTPFLAVSRTHIIWVLPEQNNTGENS